MIETFQSSGNSLASERRIHWRQSVLHSCAELGGNTGAVVLNISASGLALQAVGELIDDDLPKVRFKFSRMRPWIETEGRIVWRSDATRTVGVKFIGLPAEARNQIQSWIALVSRSEFEDATAPLEEIGRIRGPITSSEPSSAIVLPDLEPVRPAPENRDRYPIARLILPAAETQGAAAVPSSVEAERLGRAAPENAPSGSGRALRVAGLSLAALLLLSGCVFLAYFFQRSPSSTLGTDVTTAPKMPESSPSSTSPKALSLDPTLPLNRVGFVLQVGAMIHEENANALVGALLQKNFPAFVFKHRADPFYHVVVGPYNHADSTARVKNELEDQGFKAIRTPWKGPSSGVDNLQIRHAVGQEAESVALPSSVEQDGKDAAEPQSAEGVSQRKDNGQADLALARRYLRESSAPGYGPKAAHLLWLAIEKGNTEAEAQLADLYLRGEGVPKNCSQARILLRAAHNENDIVAAPISPESPEDGCK